MQGGEQMKVRYRLANAEIEVDGKDTKDAFTQLSGAVEVFGQSQCGACGGKDVVPVCREVQGNNFFELRCLKCGATLAFGQRKQDGALYPRRKDKDGEYLDNFGWVKFQKRGDAAEPF
jgi:hypothetical protein